MSRPCALALLLAAVVALPACQGRSKPWPKSAGTTPYRDEDLGQSLAPAQPPMSAVERGKSAPTPATNVATPAATASDASAAPTVAPAAPQAEVPSAPSEASEPEGVDADAVIIDG